MLDASSEHEGHLTVEKCMTTKRLRARSSSAMLTASTVVVYNVDNVLENDGNKLML